MVEYIERESALESLCTGCEYVPIEEKEVCPYRFTGCQEYANIFAIPAADVVPVVHGKWIRIDKYDKESPVQCSACLADFSYIDGVCWLCSGYELPLYCPNCGALMDKDGDGE